MFAEFKIPDYETFPEALEALLKANEARIDALIEKGGDYRSFVRPYMETFENGLGQSSWSH